tara:strand:+ start:3008 stop:3412 length:405 start_codon:yes stop_codon:yes gene_type:complete
MIEIFRNSSAFLIPFLIGGLIFFSAIVAPNTFKSLDEKNARLFIRNLFPKLYTYAAIFSLVISITLLKNYLFYSFIFFIITLGYLYSKFFLMIKINEVADKKDTKKFNVLHRFSVIIFLLQLILMMAVYFILFV